MDETDVNGTIIVDKRGQATIKTGDFAYHFIYTGLESIVHGAVVLATGMFIGQSFLSHKMDVLWCHSVV